MSKTGEAARNMFARTAAERKPNYGPGRPPVHEEEWTKVTVVLLNRQIIFLDLVAADIRATTGAAIKRAEIIRALIDALAESDTDLTAASTEADLKAILT